MVAPSCLLVTLLVVAPPAHAAPLPLHGHAGPHAFRPGELLVAWSAPIDPVSVVEGRAPATPGIARALAAHGLRRAKAIGARAGGLEFAVLASDQPGFDPSAAAADLVATGAVRAATANWLLDPSITIPNDPYVLPQQWYIQSTADADVDLPEAWDLGRGDTSVVIGIADTGVDIGHPDLVHQIWTNRGEIPGNGIDDDHDGYVDDVHGWDFGDGDADPNPTPYMDPDLGIDIGFHGTFVAGIAAAETNNGLGMAGAGWKCRIMPLKLTDSTGAITTEAMTAAFLYATAHHADVLNLSLGSPGDPGVPAFYQQLVDVATAAGTLCVAAAGNDADSARVYPAACDGAVAVAATDQSNFRAEFSNWGPWIDIAAPGVHLLSLMSTNYTVDDYSQIFYLYLFGWDGVNPYLYGDGSSFATPIVSGTCGLVRAKWRLAPAAMLAHLKATGDALPFDLPIGPKLNAQRALATATAAPVAPPATRTASLAVGPNPFRERAAVDVVLPSAADAAISIVDVSGRTVRTLARGGFGAGARRFDWDGRDDSGRPVGSGVYFVMLDPGGRGARVVERVARVR